MEPMTPSRMDTHSATSADTVLTAWAEVAGRARRPAEVPTRPGSRATRALLPAAGVVVAGLVFVVIVGALLPGRGGDRLVGGIASPAVASPGVASSPEPTATPWEAACPVTMPNEAHTAAWPPSTLDHGQDGLFTVLWPDGTVLVPRSEIGAGGLLWMKFVFQREGAAIGPLQVGGLRVGAHPGDPLSTIEASIPDGYGDAGIQATGIGFPSAGCWEVVVTSGSSELRFVTRVDIDPGTGPSGAQDGATGSPPPAG